MITLPGHCEYLSDPWLDEARRFLKREAAHRKDRLNGRPFSVSERFADAPTHLKAPGGVIGWSLRWDGETIAVSREADETADLVIEGDYQAALTAAQFVGVLAPGAMATMKREVATMFGADAIRVKGALADEAAREMMALLHDHMGRRTVENPDLAHRAARQGLTGKIRHQTFSMNWMLYHGREFEQLVQNPLLMTLIDASLGRGAVIASFSSIKKGPGPGVIPMHTDYAHVPEPYPEFAMTGVGVWALEDWTLESGPTWIVPGSHRMRRPPRPGEGHNAGVPIVMPKGSVVFFTHGVWHWQGDRTEAGDRVTLHAHFNRGILRSLEPKKTDVQMLHRNPPRLGEMLGEDDWFDKMSASGRDHTRFAYMQKLHAFTETRKQAILSGAD